MMGRRYTFGSVWHIQAPLSRCWEFLAAPSQQWLDWWPRLRDIDVRRTDGLVGSLARCTWQSPVGYRLHTELLVTDVRARHGVEMTTRGDLAGVAFVGFAELPDRNGTRGTRIEVTWRVMTTRRWMNLSAPLLRPLFTWGHAAVMRGGERGLNATLSA
ncbi:hypothetical protein [Phytoactinopolyspora limicola]|uniref:hypothetical protein n=1 Tax=Phytoactinopolyspora limicola TaxID=2715536 RepID=UPI0014073E0D|nr:hypothetical protein [Phytoactinopolyspora limicola]